MNNLSKSFSNRLEYVQCQFLCCRPVKDIDWKDILKNISWENQELLANETVLCPLLVDHNINVSYQITFLRFLIEKFTETNEEIHDIIYEKYVELKKNNSNEQFYYKHYKIPKYDTIVRIKESRSVIAHGTTGLCSWQAASALAEWAIANQERFRSKFILELGSGTGLTAFIIAKICKPSQLLLTDGHHLVINLLKDNFKENFKEDDHSITDIEWLDWNNIENLEIAAKVQPDVIIASDVIYDNTLFEPLCKTIDNIFKQCDDKCSMILAYTIRNPVTVEEFLRLLDSLGFKQKEEQVVPPTLIYWDNKTPIKILTITR